MGRAGADAFTGGYGAAGRVVPGWSEFISWVEAPAAYNWITLIGVAGGLMTAVFTGYSAGTQWADRRKRVIAEWDSHLSNGILVVTCSITNKTKGTITGEAVEAFKFSPEIRVSGAHEKHKSWGKNRAPLNLAIPPDQADRFSVSITADPDQVRKAMNRYSSRLKGWISRALWSSLHWRVPLGASISIRVTLRRKSSEMRPIRVTHRIRMNEVIVMHMEQNRDAKAAAK
jgi:hypothetical protein